jgi:hypothetical protein
MMGAAWKANAVSVRQGNGVSTSAGINSANAASAVVMAVENRFYYPQWVNQRRIVSMAWGAVSNHSNVEDAIRYTHGLGALHIAASGTSGWYLPGVVGVVFPARMEQVIAVSAVNPDGSQASGIHYGSQVELSAYIDQLGTGQFTTQTRTVAGSSAATAAMAGIAALVWTQYPNESNQQIRQRLRAAGHIFPSRNDVHGYGIVNAMKAVGGMYDTSVNGCVGQTDCTQDLWISGCTTEQITAHPMGGDGPFAYTWTNGSTNSSTTMTMCANPGTVQYYSLGNTVTDTSDGTSVSKQLTFRVIDMWNPPCGGEWIC